MLGTQGVTDDPRGTSLLSRGAGPSKRAPGPRSGSTSEAGGQNQLLPPGQGRRPRKGNGIGMQMSSSQRPRPSSQRPCSSSHRPCFSSQCLRPSSTPCPSPQRLCSPSPATHSARSALPRPPPGGMTGTNTLMGQGLSGPCLVSSWLLCSPLVFAPCTEVPASPQPARGSSHISPLQPQPGVPSDVAPVTPAGTCWLRGTRSLEQPVVCLDFSSVELSCVTQWRRLNQQRPGGRDRKSRLRERVSRCQGGRSPRFHRPELSVQD